MRSLTHKHIAAFTPAIIYWLSTWFTIFMSGCASTPAPEAPGPEPTSYEIAEKTAQKVEIAQKNTLIFDTQTPSADVFFPWPELSEPIPNADLRPLQDWLNTSSPSLTGPESFVLDQTATSFHDNAENAGQWNTYVDFVASQSTRENLSMNEVLLFATFWLRGLRVNMEESIKQMAALLITAKTLEPSHPLPYALEALFFSRVPDIETDDKAFEDALSREPSDKLKQLLHLGYSSLCLQQGNVHQSILQAAAAIETIPVPDKYRSIVQNARLPFVAPGYADFSIQELFAQQGAHIRSMPLGIEFQIPPGWRITKATPFHPKNREALIVLTLARRPQKNKDVSIVVVVEEMQFPHQPSAHLTPVKPAQAPTPLPLPTVHPQFTHWIRFLSPNAAGSQPTYPVTLAAVAEVPPSTWTYETHMIAAQSEGPCSSERSQHQLAFSMNAQMEASSIAPPTRLNRPLRIIVLSGTTPLEQNSALERMATFTDHFQIFDKSETTLLTGF